MGQIANGATDTQVAAELTDNSTYYGIQVTGWYAEYLGRSPSASEQAYWVTALSAGATDEQVIADLVSSPEYINDLLSH